MIGKVGLRTRPPAFSCQCVACSMVVLSPVLLVLTLLSQVLLLLTLLSQVLLLLTLLS